MRTLTNMPAAAIEHILLPPAAFAANAARALIARHHAALPDLRPIVVAIPDLHAAGDVARALQHAAQVPVLLAPRITTLRAWAAEAVLTQPVLGGAAREMLLYRALAERHWFDEQDLWAVCGELAALFDELTRECVELAATQAEFSARLGRAYRQSFASTRGSGSLDFEARLVYDLWRAFTQAGGALDAESAYVARLARLAAEAEAPLYLLAPQGLSRAEQGFLERYAARAPVIAIVPKQNTADAVSQTLAAAWPATLGDNLLQRAAALRAAHPTSALAAHVRIAAAPHAEAHAQMIDTAVRERVAAGCRRIGVVVQDRLVARRARALLERADVLVADEAGWALSTVSAATVIARWLDVASGGCHHSDLFDLLKSPFVLHDWPRDKYENYDKYDKYDKSAARDAVVQRFEQQVRRASVVAGFENFIALAERRHDAEARHLLLRLQRAARLLERRRAPIAQWLALLTESLTQIGVCGESSDFGGLQADAAGEQILDLLARLREELANDNLAVSFADWRRWLGRVLETATFRDRSIESPVVFTFLAATPLRAFDAVIISGADAAHLPGAETAALFFNQNVRAELGLPTRADAVREIDAALRGLIVNSCDVLVTWQRAIDGEANLLSPFFERLNALHALTYGATLDDDTLAARAAVSIVTPPRPAALPAIAAQPAPIAPKQLILNRISASGYNALMACPYQYHARYVLGLAELDDVQELIDKADYGSAVHAALTAFHHAHPCVSDLAADDAVRALETATEAAFRGAIAANYLARAWLARWKPLIAQYLDWQRAREADGWRFRAGEVKRELQIETPEGRTLNLIGRIDRVDSGANGAVSVIDYKTQRQETLKRKVAEAGEDVQLPVYALLWGGPIAAALFLSLEREGVKDIALTEDINALAHETRERLGVLYDALHNGTTLPAQGVDAVCQYCEMDGLCRRSHWP